MHNISSCNFHSSYDLDFSKDAIKEFYNPLLSNAISYDYMFGFFTLKSLLLATRGIENLINNDGKMRILSPLLVSDDDANIISSVTDDKELIDKVSRVLSKSINTDFLSNPHMEALGWMLLNNSLEIKIILMKKNSLILSSKQITGSALFHNKIGIVSDDMGNIVSFSGSINEGHRDWCITTESFEVFCNWEIGSEKYIEAHLNKFKKYWNFCLDDNYHTIILPEVIKNRWIESVPREKENLTLFKSVQNKTQLRDYQEKAIEKWAENNFRGIFNMATGTGKTITSMFAVRKLMEKLESGFLLVVAVPNQHLIPDPWVKSLKNYLFVDDINSKIVEAFSGNRNWEKDLSKLQMDHRLGIIKLVCIVTTYDTLSSNRFINTVGKFSGKKIIIADEVHNAGADTFQRGLLEEYDYRLGLSATPIRYLDDDGTQLIINYFEKEVFSFTLKEAISKVNPDTGKTILTPYYYHPIFVTLNNDELEDYAKLTLKIAKLFSIEEPTPRELKLREGLLIKRSRIGKNALSKTSAMKTLVPELKKNGFFNHCLVYCSDGRDPEDSLERTLNNIIGILNENDIRSRRFTSEDAFSTRPQILEDFANGEISTLVAIKCLDEGIDIPVTQNAIIMASTGNPREYIQRRGRILRPAPGKTYATLYDFIIIPSGSDEYRDAELQLFKSEYRRFKEFSDISLNASENNILIEEIIRKFNIIMEAME